MRFLIFAALVVAFSSAAQAATNSWSSGAALDGVTACSEGFVDAGGSAGAAANLARSRQAACWTQSAFGSGEGTCTATILSQDVSGSGPSYVLDVELQRGGVGCGLAVTVTETFNFTDDCGAISSEHAWDGTYGGCYVPPDCSDFAGQQVDRFFSDSGPGGPICAAPQGSEMTECGALVAEPSGFAACAGGECFARVVFTGDVCGGGEPDATGEDLVDEPGSRNCVSGDGVTICAAQDSQNCGTVNGESVCLESIPPGRCTFLGNGGMVCASGASNPPAPTESDGTTPATPDGGFAARGDDAEEGDFDYYGPGTVSGSGTATSGTSSGDTDEPAEEDDEACAGEDECDTALPSIEEQPTFGETTSATWGAVQATPLFALIDDATISTAGAACPHFEFELWDVTYDLNPACDMWDDIAAVLSVCALFGWAIVAIRVLISA